MLFDGWNYTFGSDATKVQSNEHSEVTSSVPIQKPATYIHTNSSITRQRELGRERLIIRIVKRSWYQNLPRAIIFKLSSRHYRTTVFLTKLFQKLKTPRKMVSSCTLRILSCSNILVSANGATCRQPTRPCCYDVCALRTSALLHKLTFCQEHILQSSCAPRSLLQTYLWKTSAKVCVQPQVPTWIRRWGHTSVLPMKETSYSNCHSF